MEKGLGQFKKTSLVFYGSNRGLRESWKCSAGVKKHTSVPELGEKEDNNMPKKHFGQRGDKRLIDMGLMMVGVAYGGI